MREHVIWEVRGWEGEDGEREENKRVSETERREQTVKDGDRKRETELGEKEEEVK